MIALLEDVFCILLNLSVFYFQIERTDRTDVNTIQAGIAFGFGKRHVGKSTYPCIDSPVSKIKNACSFFMTYINTFTAEYALIAVEDNERMAVVYGIIQIQLPVRFILHFKVLMACYFLQGTPSVFYTVSTIQVVSAEQQVK